MALKKETKHPGIWSTAYHLTKIPQWNNDFEFFFNNIFIKVSDCQGFLNIDDKEGNLWN